ncbi:MAG: Jag N-terminal domain-containing protein [Campylobacterota bacterium]|nr:Jag N-terminal domain-containing protein [Campylobacterota bacterium]
MKNSETLYEAKTLEEAYEKASESLKCSIVDLNIELVQSPSKGFLGFFSKVAIIKATINHKKNHPTPKKQNSQHSEVKVETLSTKLNSLNEQKNNKNEVKVEETNKSQIKKEKIFNDFYSSNDEETLNKENSELVIKKDDTDLENEIKDEINRLFSYLCYEIDEIKVEILKEENTVYIEFSGADSALLIGKEGYRYKALSYILFNWINEKYNMMLRLEVAEFLANQEVAIHNYLDPVIEIIKNEGYFKTKILDGILVHIALTKLRDEFPNKYVAVKTNQKGEKYILVNEYRN